MGLAYAPPSPSFNLAIAFVFYLVIVTNDDPYFGDF